MEIEKNIKMYKRHYLGGTIIGSRIEVVGEETIEEEDGRECDCYLYNIIGYTPENGKLFVALKANVFLDEPIDE